MSAYVYLIEEEPISGESSGPWIKIGYSKNLPEWRMNTNLKRGNPRNLRVVEAFEFDTEQEALAAEKLAHDHFHEYAHQKEWFRIKTKEVTDWFLASGAKRKKEIPS